MTQTVFSDLSPAGAGVRVGVQSKWVKSSGQSTMLLRHGETYQVGIKNQLRDRRVLADIQIDGKSVGKFVIAPDSTQWIERPVSVARKFTFYQLGSSEAREANLDSVSNDDLGLLKVVVSHEKNPTKSWDEIRCESYRMTTNYSDDGVPRYARDPYQIARPAVAAVSDVAAGGTGLSSNSTQHFVPESMETGDTTYEFNIRLGVEVNNVVEVRPPVVVPLVSTESRHVGTPVPPPFPRTNPSRPHPMPYSAPMGREPEPFGAWM